MIQKIKTFFSVTWMLVGMAWNLAWWFPAILFFMWGFQQYGIFTGIFGGALWVLLLYVWQRPIFWMGLANMCEIWQFLKVRLSPNK
jgi:hypothetical protein